MAIDGVKIIDSDSGYDIYNNIIGCCPKSLKITFASLHFAKVSDFGKVDYSDYQSFL